MTKKILQLIVVLLIATQGVMAQSVEIDNVTVAPGDITVQVDMLGFTGSNGGITAISLYVEFDADLMDFTGIDDTQIPGGWLANYNSYTNSIVITYTTGVPGTGYDIDGKAFDLQFFYKGGFSDSIKFDEPICEIIQGLTPITGITYVNGSVTQTAGLGTVSMSDLVDTVGNTVNMPLNMEGAGFASVSGFTYKIAFDQFQLSFPGPGSIVEYAVTGVTASANDGILTLTWSGGPMDFTSFTHLLDIQFVYHGGNADVEFYPGCEIIDGNLDPIAFDYTNGTVTAVAGTPTLTITNVGGTPGQTVLVPIDASAFGSEVLGAITLVIDYDDSKLTYAGFTAQQFNGFWTIGPAGGPGQIELEMVKASGGTLTDATMITLAFVYDTLGGQADIEFAPGSIVKDINLATVPVSFIHGSIASYTGTFVVLDAFGAPITDAEILMNWTLNAAGDYVFPNLGNGIYPYVVAKAGYLNTTGNMIVLGADVTDTVVLYIGYTIDGKLSYMGDAVRPIATAGTSTTTVYLKNAADSTVAYTTTTDSNGDYIFFDVIVGSYFLDAATDIDSKLSYDVTDAFVIYGSTVPPNPPLSGLFALAGDVNDDGFVDVTDSFIVYGSVFNGNVKGPSWFASDWFFDNTSVVVTGNVTQDFSAICSGDANGDFVPIP